MSVSTPVSLVSTQTALLRLNRTKGRQLDCAKTSI